MVTSTEEKYKTFMKECYKGKNPKVVITIRTVRKKILDMKLKEEKGGNVLIRVHTDDDKAPTWYLHAVIIPFSNLGIEKIKNKREMAEKLTYQEGILHADTKSLLKKLVKDYGEISEDGRKKHMYKTEHFKKQKDPYKVKMKAF